MSFARNTLAGLCLLALAACGGNSDTPSSATLTVTPSLGKVLGGDVRVYNLQGTLIAQGFLGTEGSVELDFGTLPAGFVVELVGGPDIWYFDEGIGGYRPLAQGQVLHAVSAGARGSVTVTAFTELMYQRALMLAGGGTLTAAHIAQAEADVQALLGIAAGNSLLDVPEILDSPLDLPSTDTWAGQQAGLLAAFTRLALFQPTTPADCRADLDCAPLPGFIALLAEDFRDGSLDSQAAGTSLDTPYTAVTDPATWLAGALDFGANAYRNIVTVAREQPTTDQLIGDHLAGRYELACQRTQPLPGNASFPVAIDIAADGSFTLQAPSGRYLLSAGNSYAHIAQLGGDLAITRQGLATPAGTVAVGNAPTADGLVIDINPPGGTGGGIIVGEQLPAAPFVSVALNSTSPSQIIAEGERWECPAITGSEQTLIKSTARLAGWLPDGDYVCEDDGNPSLLRLVAASGGVLSVAPENSTFTNSLSGITSDGSVTLISGTRLTGLLFTEKLISSTVTTIASPLATVSLADYPFAMEVQNDPLGYVALPDYGHAHQYDGVAATLFPRQSLWLTVPPAGPDLPVTQSLTIHRSLVSGQRYFDLVSGSLVLRHCQRRAFFGSLSGDSSGDGIIPISIGNQPPDTCWGNTQFC